MSKLLQSNVMIPERKPGYGAQMICHAACESGRFNPISADMMNLGQDWSCMCWQRFALVKTVGASVSRELRAVAS